MHRLFIGLGALNALLAVAAGAFAAHGLKQAISADLLAAFNTGAQYHFYHALGMVLAGILQSAQPAKYNVFAGWLMLAGIILFSGSLYVLGLTSVKWLGMITPFGGLCFLAAWLLLAWHYLFNKN